MLIGLLPSHREDPLPVPRIEEIFQATVGLPSEARRAEVARLCAGDAALEARCLRLLEAADEATRAGAWTAAPPRCWRRHRRATMCSAARLRPWPASALLRPSALTTS